MGAQSFFVMNVYIPPKDPDRVRFRASELISMVKARGNGRLILTGDLNKLGRSHVEKSMTGMRTYWSKIARSGLDCISVHDGRLGKVTESKTGISDHSLLTASVRF